MRALHRVLAFLLCTVSLAAQPQQLPAGDFRVTQSMHGHAANHRYDLRLTTNGQNFLAGWIDERTGFEARRLIVTRLDRAGNALDGQHGSGIALGEPWNVAEFSIASDGVDYLVVWRPIEGVLQLVRIDGSTGAVTPLPAIDDNSIYNISLLWMGDRYVLVSRTDAYAYDLDRSGRLTGTGRAIASPDTPIVALKVVPTGTQQLLAVWTEESGKTYANQIGTAPAVVTPILVAESGVITALTSSGSTAMAVLSTPIEQRTQLSTLILGANGAVVRGVEAAGEAVATPQRTDVTWDGSRFQLLVVANDARSVRVTSYNATGGLLEYPRTVATGEMYDVVGASAQGETVAVYTWRTAGTGIALQLRAKNISGAGTNDKLISLSEPESGLPTVVWRGDHYLSVWLDRYGDRSVAQYMGIHANGTPWASSRTFATGVNAEDDRLSVASDGRKALIVWYERGDSADIVKAMLVEHADEDSSLQTLITLHEVSRVQSSIAVRWNGSEYLVTWASQEPRGLYAMRIAADGTKLDAQPTLLVSERATSRPAIAWNGTHWTVAYVALVPRDPEAEYLEFDSYIHAIQFTRGLTVTGTPMRLSVAEPGPPKIASRDSEVLVVWGTSIESYEIYGARIVNGANLDAPHGFRIGAGSPASIHATDTHYLVLEEGGHGHTVQSGMTTGGGKLFPFVPELAKVDLVLGGPKPLVVYRAWPTGREQVPQVWARYWSEPTRRRAVRR